MNMSMNENLQTSNFEYAFDFSYKSRENLRFSP